MPVDKHVFHRLSILDRLLRRFHQPLSLQDLHTSVSEKIQEEFGLADFSIRTLQRDIKTLRLDYHAPVEVISRKYYRYQDPSFSIHGRSISSEELRVLKDVAQLLNGFGNFKQVEDFQEIIQRLTLGRSEGILSDNEIVFHHHPPFLQGEEWINPLFSFCDLEVPIELDYKPFAKDAFRLQMSPYFLKEYNGRWFVFGWDHDKSRVATLAVDRIESLKKSGGAIKYDARLAPILKKKLAQIIGVSLDIEAEPQEVIIKLSPARAPYLFTKPLHTSQQMLSEDAEGACVFSLQVIPNKELTTILLSFGPDLQVLAPDWLKEDLISKLTLTLASYS